MALWAEGWIIERFGSRVFAGANLQERFCRSVFAGAFLQERFCRNVLAGAFSLKHDFLPAGLALDAVLLC